MIKYRCGKCGKQILPDVEDECFHFYHYYEDHKYIFEDEGVVIHIDDKIYCLGCYSHKSVPT